MNRKFEILAKTSKGKTVVVATVEAKDRQSAYRVARRFAYMASIDDSRLREVKP